MCVCDCVCVCVCTYDTFKVMVYEKSQFKAEKLMTRLLTTKS